MERVGIDKLSEQIAELVAYDEAVVKLFMRNLLSVIKQEIEAGNEVKLEGLGVFSLIEKGGEMFSNLQFEEEFKEEVNAPFSLFEPIELVAASVKESSQELEHKTQEQINEETIEESTPLEAYAQEEAQTELPKETPMAIEINSESSEDKIEATEEPLIIPEDKVEVSEEPLISTEDKTEVAPVLTEEQSVKEVEAKGSTDVEESKITQPSEEFSSPSIEEKAEDIVLENDVEAEPEQEKDAEALIIEEKVEALQAQQNEDDESDKKEIPLAPIGSYQRPPAHDEDAIIHLRRRKKSVQMNWIGIIIFMFIVGILVCYAPKYISDFKNADESSMPAIVEQIEPVVEVSSEVSADTKKTDIVVEAEEEDITPEVTEEEVVEEIKPEVVAEVKDKLPARPKSVKLKKGERLALLARRYYGSMFFWVYIYDYNKSVYPDPDLIPLGAELLLPSPSVYGIDKDDPESIEKAKAKIETLKK